MTGCTQSSTDGNGMSLDSNPAGGTSVLTNADTTGRPANGMTLAATSDVGSSGTYSIVLFDSPLSQIIGCQSSVAICGEFLNSDAVYSARVWPILMQGSDVFVVSAAGYTEVTLATSWKGVSGTFTSISLGDKVTAFNSSSLTTVSTDLDFDTETYAGFLIQSRGPESIEYDIYIDNVCVKETAICPSINCHTVEVVIGDFVLGTSGGHFDPDCDIDSTDVSLFTTEMNGTWLLPGIEVAAGVQTWRRTANADVVASGYEIYNGALGQLWLDIQASYNNTSGDPAIIIKPWFTPNSCSLLFLLATWQYKITRSSFLCDTVQTYSLYSSTAGECSIVSAPSTITVEYQSP